MKNISVSYFRFKMGLSEISVRISESWNEAMFINWVKDLSECTFTA
jgi:hypothetical protein